MGEKFPSKHPRQLTPVPVFVEHPPRQPAERISWFTLCVQWFQYHSTQIRWYIERRVARLLHRRWT
jgi:hypothetical protein